jgi:exodeoxyribonuclease-5
MGISRKDLTDEQEVAFNHILEFLKSPERQMLLGGYAGTGKTTMVKVLLDHLDTTYHNATCTAPTNEAVRVIAKLTGRRKFQKTIYSLLGLALIQTDDRPPILRPTSESKLGEYDVVFIDEASMIQAELFDMIQHELTLYSNVKVIYIGDDAQLPPVKDEGRDSKVFMIENKIILKEVQRTAKESPIIKVVTIIRNNLDSPSDAFDKVTVVNREKNIGVIFYDDRETYLKQIYDDFNSDHYKIDSNYVRVVAYTNKTVNAMNSRIRKQIFKTNEIKEYEVGENLIVDEPILDYNGKTIVFTVGERLRVKNATLEEDQESLIKFWKLTVENYEEDDFRKIVKVIHVVHKNYISVYRFTLTQYANQAKKMMADKKIRYSKREAWRAYFEFKNQFSWVKYSYATTIHKSQGSTFENVYVINADCNKLSWNHKERNKLKYVAFTRPSHLLKII